jgi:hypothetical protein
MEGLDNFEVSIDSSSEWMQSASPEAIREKSEKQKESYSKALAGIARSRKDEKKSQFQDELLAKIIAIVIQDGDSDEIISLLENLSMKHFPSFIISWIVSLASPAAIHCILEHYRLVNGFPVLKPRLIPIQFNQEMITQEEKMYINSWVELMFTLIKTNPSAVTLKKLYLLLDDNEKILVQSLSTSFTIFLSKLSILESKDIPIYSQFIISQLRKSLSTIVFEDIDTGKLTHL